MFKKLFLMFCVALAAPALAARAQPLARKFEFGAGRAVNDSAPVAAADVYAAEKGYGFEPGANVTCFETHGKNNRGLCVSDKPFYFSVRVPEGNYRVTVTFGDETHRADATVKAELRRLMLERVATRAGEFVKKSFVVNVRNPQFPGGAVKLKDREKTIEWWAWDEKLTLEFNGARPAINAIEIERIESPTVYLLGDSTVCDQPREPYASWGQMLPRFFGANVAVANHAESGESLKSSLGAKRLDKVISLLKPGDYVFIQFGHNDEKEKGAGVGAFTTYQASLKKYVQAIRAKGGSAVLITPMHRRTFDGSGKITNSHGDYPEAVRRAAREEKVPLIDLTQMSESFYEALGAETSVQAFKDGDATHHNNYGAYELAKMIVRGIRANKIGVSRYLSKDAPAYDPARPASPAAFMLPASPLATDVKPLGN